jgi:hypothetical protein
MTFGTFRKLTVTASISFWLMGCGGEGSDSNGSGRMADTLLDTAQHASGSGVVKVGNKLFNIPSPVETALLIKRAGMPYHKDRTLPLERAENLASKLERGMALGMYGADMAYVTIHRDGPRALATLQAIEKLGTALDVSNAFDRALIDRYRNNLNNEDSLLRMSSDAFGAADRYLKTSERDDVSAFVLAGGWLESMHLILAEGTLNDQLATRVGEQKRTLTDLIALLRQTDKENACAELLSKLESLQTILNGVNTMYQYSEPITDAGSRTTTITSKSSVSISADQIKALADKIEGLRSTISA